MSTSAFGLTLTVVWYDEQMLELKLVASNGNFSAQTSFYAGLNAPQELARVVAGFPSSVGEAREFEFGGQELRGYGGLTLRLLSEDSLGHLLVTLSASKAPLKLSRPVETATFSIPTSPSDIDSFAQALQKMGCQVGSTATLRAAT